MYIVIIYIHACNVLYHQFYTEQIVPNCPAPDAIDKDRNFSTGTGSCRSCSQGPPLCVSDRGNLGTRL